MNTVRGIARDLVDKRLWPVAVLLVVGIVAAAAIGLTASRSEPAQAPLGGAGGPGITSGVVVPADAVELNADRELLGVANDPFRRSVGDSVAAVASAPGVVAPQTGLSDPAPAPGGEAQGGGDPFGGDPFGGGMSGGGGGGAPSAGGAPSGGGGSAGDDQADRVSTGPVETPEPAARREPDRTFTLWEVDARVYRDGSLVRDLDDPASLTPLPTAGRPSALFLGVFNGGSSAGFVIHRSVDVQGSNCEARAERDCSLLRLGEGSDATLSVEEDGREGGEKVVYQIVVDEIRKVTTRDERRATAHRERRSSFGSCLLKTVGQDYGAVLFDPARGTWSAGGSPEDCYKR
ncbi:MAG: hypothetical protein MSC31_09285 [Solirubrobacteraceae bacterium MAG38_C4-C5]|nr:hypothetical protein [Candidatus Siliceabacter maunaloa]